VALLERLKRSAAWLQALCAARLARLAQASGAVPGERPIRLVDGSRLEGPGHRVWRLHLCYDAGAARIVDAAITTTQQGERLDRLAVTPGEIRLGDRGLPQPDGIRNTLDAGADLLVRLTWNSLQLSGADGQALDWLRLFEQASAQGSCDLPVRLHKAHARFAPLALRLVVLRKPPAAAVRARAQARRSSAKNQRRLDPRTLAGADHLILLTSLSPEAFPVERLAALYRLRWQVELAFKRLKSILHLDRLPAKDPALARAWLYAHLLFALLVDETVAELDAVSP
jgi:Transposase DDE domain